MLIPHWHRNGPGYYDNDKGIMMVSIKTVGTRVGQIKADCYAFVLPKDFSFSPALKAFARALCPDLEQLLHDGGFEGDQNQLYSFPVITEDGNTVHIVCAGVGVTPKRGAIDVESYRCAVGRIAKQAEKAKCASVAFALPSGRLFGVAADDLAREAAMVINLAAYRLTDYLSKDNKPTLKDFSISVDTKDVAKARKAVAVGIALAEAMNHARYWIDLPPSDLTPPELCNKAKGIARGRNLKFTCFTEKQVTEMGMGGLAGVSRGSHLDARLVVLEYAAKKKDAPKIVLVGKGITFDSGGLNIKPGGGPGGMEKMKDDMSGAAAVIAAMDAIAQLKPDVHVIAVAPLAENMPSHSALKPGDILKFYNGKTAEVLNTDAEGRLILADALAYAAKKYKPDAMVDIATLTGACMYALGVFYTGLMTQHDEVAKQLEKAAERTGDRVWRLPLDNDYEPAIQSTIADINNVGSAKYMGGATTAALFLKHFVGDTPWAHLDIAGTAFGVPDRPYLGSGATGAGVRLLVDFVMNWRG